ncbi:hypothetical protein AB0I81_09100 [Nonomuraea sp. NPDC050404]|uniref:hypothetical protein n=1 Tax=Nonomuraea sp. NPDC050404 TaxID=3155783 RepID=UPI0033EF208A
MTKAEKDAHVTEHGTITRGEARRDDEIADLKRKLADKTRECGTLQRSLDAAATAIAALHHDNTLLRQDLAARSGTVTSLHRSRGQEHDRP